MSRETGFLGIVGRVVRDATPKTRWSLVGLLGCGLFAILLPFVDGTRGGGALDPQELFSIVPGTIGTLLVSLAYVLHNSAEERSKGCGMLGMGFRPRSLHQVLLTLPVIGLVGGVLLGAAVGLLVMWAAESGEPIYVFAAAAYFGVMLLAARVVYGTTGFLFTHAREQAEQAAEARNQATEAQLSALQARMNPHFLFNALNTVASLVRESPETAERTVEHLADVLRRTLDHSRDPMRTVGDELEYLEAYLAVEQERWGDRLDVEWRIDPQTRPLPLPPMTLQPLVENALKHGLGGRLEGGELTIEAGVENGHLMLTVTDDGAGLPPRAPEGTGLGNLRRRLATLYGDEARLGVERRGPRHEPGTRVVVELPVSGPGT